MAAVVGGAGCTTTVIGSGRVVDKSVAVSSFDRLQVSSSFDVTVAGGSTPALTLHVDSNVVDHLEVGVSDGMLRVGLKPHLSIGPVTLKAEVVSGPLRSIELRGASRVHLSAGTTASTVRMGLS